MPAPAILKGFEKVIASAKPIPGKRQTIGDPDTRGLFLRVMPTGSKSFTVVSRAPGGKQVWASLGDCERLSLKEARALAPVVIARIKAGQSATEKPEQAPETFRDVLEGRERDGKRSGGFLARHVDGNAHRTARETRRIFTKYVLPEWKDKVFVEIRRGDVARLLDGIEDNSGPVMADRTLAALSKLFGWYVSRSDDYVSPIVRGMGRSNGRERARTRILSDDEIRLVWKAAKGPFGALVQTLLLTGQRRAKVSEMRWEDIDAEGLWTIPAEAREKTNAGQLQLPPMALAIINAQPHIVGNPYVFAGRGKKAMNGFSPLKRDLDEAAPIPHWVLHDLRRTAKSLMARAGVRPDVSERVLGHAIVGVEGVYDRHSYAAEKADALARLAGLVGTILEPQDNKVVPLRRRKA